MFIMSDSKLNSRIRDVYSMNLFNNSQLDMVIKGDMFVDILRSNGAIFVGTVGGLHKIIIPDDRIEDFQNLLTDTGFAVSLE